MDKAHIVLMTLVAYKVLLIGIGIWASKRTQSSHDFFLGDRGLGPIVAALSYSSSAASAWVLLGLTGIAYQHGLSTIWVPIGSILTVFITWIWVAPRLMTFSRQHNHISLTEVIAHGQTGRLRTITLFLCSIIVVTSFIFYIAAQFQGAGNTFATTFDISMTSSIIIGAVIIMVYTLLGGFWAVSVTDAVQGSLMALAAIVMPIAAYVAVGGIEGLMLGLASSGNSHLLSFNAGHAGWLAVGFVVGGLSIGIGTFGQPHLMARIMALRDKNALRHARTIACSWYVVVFMGMWFVGLTGHVLHNNIGNSEDIFFIMLDGLFPPILSAVFLAAVLSAIMSTADSQLLAAATAIANDLGLGKQNPQKLLLISRITIVILVALAVALALQLPAQIFERVLFAWMALGAAFGPSLFARLAGMPVKALGTILSISLGFGLTVILSLLPNTPGDVAERLIPIITAFIVLLIFRDKNLGQEPH